MQKVYNYSHKTYILLQYSSPSDAANWHDKAYDMRYTQAEPW